MVSDKIQNSNKPLSEILVSLKKALKVTSDRGLSETLGLSESAIAMSRRNGKLPYASIVVKCVEHSLSVDSIFGIDTENTVQTKVVSMGCDKLIEVSEIVGQVLNEVLEARQLPPERELLVYKKLHPILIKAAFENDFNYLYVKGMAEGALMANN